MRQLYATAKLDGVKLAVGLPDLHPGKGHPVGAAFVTEGWIYPYLIGSDIGCGMALFKTDLLRRKAKLDRWAEKLHDLEHTWEGDVAGWREQFGLAATEFDESLGTIGGGNHFAELQAVEEIFDAKESAQVGLCRDNLMVLIHSGSRGLGESTLRNYVGEHHADGVAVESEAAAKYLTAHDAAVCWAKANRALIAARFAEQLNAVQTNVWDACHNSMTRVGDTDGRCAWVHRKGATPSVNGALVIPGSRGTLSYVVLPLGEQSGNAWSLAHGAGRKWTRSDSRSRMRERFRAAELEQTALGSRVVCENRDLLYEEAPAAYKNIERVIEDLVEAGLVRVIATLRPLITYKTRAMRR